MADTDIDIDFADREAAANAIPHVAAMMRQRDERVRHSSGIYIQNIPVDPVNGLSAIPYQDAGSLGYFKIDYLNNSIYGGVRDEEHLMELMDREPPWDFLDERDIVKQLQHIHSHFGVVRSIRPKSVYDLAVVLALIRPGKKALIFKHREEIEREIWKALPGEYAFKKAHAIAYATAIVVQLNLLYEKMVAKLMSADD